MKRCNKILKEVVVALFSILAVTVYADDRIAMTIDDMPIGADEFRYHYLKTLRNGVSVSSPRQYANEFALFKLKVNEARSLGIDTILPFKKELESYAAITNGDSFLLDEYRDGMLVYEISNIRVWHSPKLTDENLSRHFEDNRSKYTWDSPKAKGWIIYADADSMLVRAVEYLDAMNDANCDVCKVLRDHFGRNVHATRFLVKEGLNPIVDALIFKNGADIAGLSEWRCACPYHCSVIDAPEEWMDVRGELIDDFHAALTADWENELCASHKVTYNFDVIDEQADI